ncbi:MAG: AAA family ATPase, partial [Gammaproteobacteria bacterium]|nr:AAA family ATPase [Gammaproteobacteria bacterium]
HLEQKIKAEILDHRLGISDHRVFLELKRLIENHAIESADPITKELLDGYLKRAQTRYLLPQQFPIDDAKYVSREQFAGQLDEMIAASSGEYIIVTGPPGSGKSTTLTKHFDALSTECSDKFVVVRYYCFVRPNENLQKRRLEATSLRVNLLTELRKKFSHVLDSRHFDYSDSALFEALEALGEHCGNEGLKLILFLDGLDHADRDKSIRDNVIEALPKELAENIVCVIGTQELSCWEPLTLKEARQNNHLAIPLFTEEESLRYIVDRCGIALEKNLIKKVFAKSGGLPLYLHYAGQILGESDDYTASVDSLSEAMTGDIRNYYESLWHELESGHCPQAKHLCIVFALLKFPVSVDELSLFQTELPNSSSLDTAYSKIKHLLKVHSSQASIFHDSFRAFLLKKVLEHRFREVFHSFPQGLPE